MNDTHIQDCRSLVVRDHFNNGFRAPYFQEKTLGDYYIPSSVVRRAFFRFIKKHNTEELLTLLQDIVQHEKHVKED